MLGRSLDTSWPFAEGRIPVLKKNRRATKLLWPPDLSLAIAALTAIALLAVIHRAILAALLARWLIRGKRSRADHRCQEREENFRVTFHTALPSLTGATTPETR